VQEPAKHPHCVGRKLKNRLLLLDNDGESVISLQDEAGEVTLSALMTAPAGI
jgi:hypothetical protein